MTTTLIIIGIILAGIAYYFYYMRWFGGVSIATGRSVNPVYFILSFACGAAGRFITMDAENPIGIIFYLASAIFFIIAVYGIITKIK